MGSGSMDGSSAEGKQDKASGLKIREPRLKVNMRLKQPKNKVHLGFPGVQPLDGLNVRQVSVVRPRDKVLLSTLQPVAALLQRQSHCQYHPVAHIVKIGEAQVSL